MKLKDNLRFLRKKAGLTQAQLAKKMHIKQYNISDYEIGRIEPSIPTLNKFADIFNVSIDFLVGRKTKPEQIEGTESNVNSYINEMQMDKYLLHIYEDIKDLSVEEKRIASESVHFLVSNVLSKKKQPE